MTSGHISQSALHIEPITARAVPIRCPHCTMLLALAWSDRFDMFGDDTLYEDGDTIFGLAEKLIAAGHVAEQEFLDFSGTWFDYGFRMGACYVCGAPYFGATVSMVAPTCEPSPGFRQKWFFHNEPHADPVRKRVTRDQTAGRDGAETVEWYVNVYDTPDCGILHEHHLGPFAWPDEAEVPDFLCPSGEVTSARQPMAWIGDHIRDLWPAFRAAVIAANRQAEGTSHERRN